MRGFEPSRWVEHVVSWSRRVKNSYFSVPGLVVSEMVKRLGPLGVNMKPQ